MEKFYFGVNGRPTIPLVLAETNNHLQAAAIGTSLYRGHELLTLDTIVTIKQVEPPAAAKTFTIRDVINWVRQSAGEHSLQAFPDVQLRLKRLGGDLLPLE